jgi:hypothetical protein
MNLFRTKRRPIGRPIGLLHRYNVERRGVTPFYLIGQTVGNSDDAATSVDPSSTLAPDTSNGMAQVLHFPINYIHIICICRRVEFLKYCTSRPSLYALDQTYKLLSDPVTQ